MKFLACLVFLVTVWQVSSQAPGDENSRCVSQRGAYPPNTRMLMDSRNYEQLITGSSAVWQAVNGDETGMGWRSSFGGLCAAQPRSCDFRESTPQDNWFFTQHIRYSYNATIVYVNITANFQECRLNPSCTQLYVDMYHNESNGVDATAARNTANYQFVKRIEQPSGFSGQQYEASFSFTPSSNTNGFYLGFRDTGTCVNILRLQVYQRVKPQEIVSLVTHPETPLPPQGSNEPVTTMATCAANSDNITSLQVKYFADGSQEGNATCACIAGYEYVAGAGGSAQCRACSQGLYKAVLGNAQCQPCPANSTVVGGVTCNCTRGHYRMNGEGATVPCTTPPSAVQNVRVTDPVLSTSVEVHWDPPLSNGGRMDGFHYNVEYREVGNLEAWIKAKDRIRSSTYRIHGLKPVTRYMIRIIAGNNVSDQEPETVGDRTMERVVTTAEGVPGPPQNVHVLNDTTVVFWQAPQEPNGNITGYYVRINTTSGRTIKEIDIPGSGKLYYGITRSDVPNDDSEAQIEVRARTLAGWGNWSEDVTVYFDTSPVVTCPPTPPPTPPPTTCPTCPPVVTCPTTPPPTACPSCPPVVTCPPTPPSPTCPPVVTCPPPPPPPTCPPVVTCPPTPPPPTCPPVVTCPPTPPPPTCPPVVTCPPTPPPTACPPVVTHSSTSTPTTEPGVTCPPPTTPTNPSVNEMTATTKSTVATKSTATTESTSTSSTFVVVNNGDQTSSASTTTDDTRQFIEVSDSFFKVSPEYASGYIIITAVATFVVTLLIMLPAVIIIACVCLKHALKKHEEDLNEKKNKW